MEKIGQLFTSYGCTLSSEDQKLFAQIQKLDQEEIILKYHPFIWGPTAAEYYSSIADSRFTLFKLPRIDQVLAQYKRDKMLRTLQRFPIDLPLDGSIEYQDIREIYDPRFILTSLFHLLSPDTAINCNKVVSLRGLSIALMATSSNQPGMRSLGYSVLSRFHFHLGSSKSTNAVFFWVHFIDSYRASLNKPNQRLPFILNNFMITAIEIINNPKDPLFYPVKRFMTSKPNFQPSHLAKLFVELLDTKELEWKSVQKTVLTILAQSIKTYEDFNVCLYHDLYRKVMSIYSSDWSDNHAKLLILRFCKSCISLPEALQVMLVEDGLVVWLTHNIVKRASNMTSAELTEFKEIVEILQKSSLVSDIPKNCLAQPISLLKSWLQSTSLGVKSCDGNIIEPPSLEVLS